MGFVKKVIKKMLGEKFFERRRDRREEKDLCKRFGVIREAIKDNAQFKDRYAGKRCFILGNGPSLKEQDLSLLEDEYVFTVNQITRHPDYEKIKSNFHFYTDPMFFGLKKDCPEDMDVYREMLKLNTKDNRPVVFFAREGYQFSKDFGLDKELDLHYIIQCLPLYEDFNRVDMTKGVPGMYTVVQYALMMAMYMGFTEIYLLGCDCTTILTVVNTRLNDGDGALYAYEMTDNEKVRYKKRNDRVPMESEFCDGYNIFRAYRILNEYAENKGIKIVNCTKGGLLDCLPRKPYEEVIGGEKI